MQLIDFIETARWIISQYDSKTKQHLFTGEILRQRMLAIRESKDKDAFITLALSISRNIAIVRERLMEHPNAQQVLSAFGLEALLDDNTSIHIAKLSLLPLSKEADPPLKVGDTIAPIVRVINSRWGIFAACINPIETLIIPQEVKEEEPFDDTLTIELDYGKAYPQAHTISSVLDNTTKLYEAFANASGNGEFPPLVIIYASSGSAFRFDLKGLGDPIKQLKGIFVDAWRLIRHRKADDFQKNGKAIVDGLNILERIEATRRKNALTSEEANRLKLNINRAMLSLLEAGAMPREIPDIESVQNRELMQGIQQKLLPPAPAEEVKKARIAKKAGTKKPAKTKRSKKQVGESSDD